MLREQLRGREMAPVASYAAQKSYRANKILVHNELEKTGILESFYTIERDGPDVPSVQLVPEDPASQGGEGTQWEYLLPVPRHIPRCSLRRSLQSLIPLITLPTPFHRAQFPKIRGSTFIRRDS